MENIYLDFGSEALLTAIAAVKKHLEYYEGVGKSAQPMISSILKKHIEKIEHISSFDEFQQNYNKQVMLSLMDNDATRNARLRAASVTPRQLEVTVKVYARNPDVAAAVLLRAKGVCENCASSAPFMRAKDNTPYLEVHHVVQLAHGGPDAINNALALCPNCHRKLHFGN